MKVSDIPAGILRRNFDWPSETEQTWRHLTNYRIYNKNNVLIDACIEDHEKEKYYKAKGTLLARPGSMTPSLKDVEIKFVECSIDYGRSAEDGNRGYWALAKELLPVDDDDDDDHVDKAKGTKGRKAKRKRPEEKSHQVYYKLEKPHGEYSKFAVAMETKVRKYLQLYDVLTKAGEGGSQHVTVNPMTDRIICKMKVDELHEKTDGAFDLDFIRYEAKFVFGHLKVRTSVSYNSPLDPSHLIS